MIVGSLGQSQTLDEISFLQPEVSATVFYPSQTFQQRDAALAVVDRTSQSQSFLIERLGSDIVPLLKGNIAQALQCRDKSLAIVDFAGQPQPFLQERLRLFPLPQMACDNSPAAQYRRQGRHIGHLASNHFRLT